MKVAQATDEQLRDAEQEIAARKRELAHQKWDAELVGRYFRVIRRSDIPRAWWPWDKLAPLSEDDYVTLERTLAVGSKGDWKYPRDYIYADVVYLHIQRRDDHKLTCSGFEVSHAHRDEPYLKIQPVFYSYADFRDYLGSWSLSTGPAKHCDEISKEEYDEALRKAVDSFSKTDNAESGV